MKIIKERIEYGGCLVGQEEEDAILKVIRQQGRRRWTIGPESVAFEKELALKTGVNHAVLVNSGSSALLAATLALKLPPKSKIIVPALTFPTAYSSIIQAGHTPVVVDCDKETLNISLDEVEEALKIFPEVKAVIAVHIAGNVVDLPALRNIVGDRYIISDNCDGYGSTMVDPNSEDWKGERYIDTYADVSCISMHAAHIISMGEGGAVLTNDATIADRARKIREWGRESGSDNLTKLEGFPEDYRERYVFTEIGYNLKPLELQCAMGRIQLKKLEKFKSERERVHDRLVEIFAKDNRFEVVKIDAQNANPCWFAFAFHCTGIKRAKVMDFFEKMNIETRTVFSGNILRHPAYKDGIHCQVGTLKNSNYVMENTMFIGSPPFYTEEQLTYIEEVLKELK